MQGKGHLSAPRAAPGPGTRPVATVTPRTYRRTGWALETGEASVTLHASVTLFASFTFVTTGTLWTLEKEEEEDAEQGPGQPLSPHPRGCRSPEEDGERQLTAGPRAPAGPGGPAGPWGPWDRREGDTSEHPPPSAVPAQGGITLMWRAPVWCPGAAPPAAGAVPGVGGGPVPHNGGTPGGTGYSVTYGLTAISALASRTDRARGTGGTGSTRGASRSGLTTVTL